MINWLIDEFWSIGINFNLCVSSHHCIDKCNTKILILIGFTSKIILFFILWFEGFLLTRFWWIQSRRISWIWTIWSKWWRIGRVSITTISSISSKVQENSHPCHSSQVSPSKSTIKPGQTVWYVMTKMIFFLMLVSQRNNFFHWEIQMNTGKNSRKNIHFVEKFHSIFESSWIMTMKWSMTN